MPGNWLGKIKDNNVDIWYSLAEKVLGPDFPYVFDKKRKIRFCSDNGLIYIFSPHFHKAYPDFRGYCENAIEAFRDDEAIISLFRQRHPEVSVSLVNDEPGQFTMAFSEIELISLMHSTNYHFSHPIAESESIWRASIGDIPLS